MKKIGTFLITTALILTTFAGCGSKEVESVVSTATSIAEEMNETNTSIAEKLDETSVPEKTDLSEYEAVEEPETEEEIPEVVETEEEIPEIVTGAVLNEEERTEISKITVPEPDSELYKRYYEDYLEGMEKWDYDASGEKWDFWLLEYIETHPECKQYTVREYFGDSIDIENFETLLFYEEDLDANLGTIYEDGTKFYEAADVLKNTHFESDQEEAEAWDEAYALLTYTHN